MPAYNLIRQDEQIRKSTTYDDTIASGLTALVTNAVVLEDDLNSLRSQVKRILGTTNWYDALSSRSLATVDTDLADIEAKKVLFRTEVLTDITVPSSQNWKILSVASSEAPSQVAAVASTVVGAVVVQSALSGAGFNVHELIEVAGQNAISPKNICTVRDASTGQAIQSSGRDVYALIQYESTGTDNAAFNDTSSGNRVKLSFVRQNSGFSDLEAVPVADIENKAINYAYVRRINFDAIPEDAFITDGEFTDMNASVDVTLDRAIDNQGSTAVSQSTDINIEIADTRVWAFKDDAAATLFSITANAPGTSTVEVAAATDNFVSSSAANNFVEGASFDTGGTPLRIGVTAGYFDTASADLGIRAGGELYLDDSNQAGSTWAQTAGIKLSDTSAEWDDFETAFGEVSILRAIYLAQAGGGVTRSKAVAAVTSATVTANTNVTGAGGSPNIDLQLPDYSGVTFVTDVDVYLNGQLMRNGANSSANYDVYPGDTPANGDLKFEFKLKSGDVITMVIYA